MIRLLKRFSWFFERITREEAERLLMAKSNPCGTFLVRPSQSNLGKYSLSVKDLKNGVGYEMKHYKINMDNNGYYVSKTQIYPTLEALVSAHRRKWFSISFTSTYCSHVIWIDSLFGSFVVGNIAGVCPVLTHPCPKTYSPKNEMGLVDFNCNIIYIFLFYVFFALLYSVVQSGQNWSQCSRAVP